MTQEPDAITIPRASPLGERCQCLVYEENPSKPGVCRSCFHPQDTHKESGCEAVAAVLMRTASSRAAVSLKAALARTPSKSGISGSVSPAAVLSPTTPPPLTPGASASEPIKPEPASAEKPMSPQLANSSAWETSSSGEEDAGAEEKKEKGRRKKRRHHRHHKHAGSEGRNQAPIPMAEISPSKEPAGAKTEEQPPKYEDIAPAPAKIPEDDLVPVSVVKPVAAPVSAPTKVMVSMETQTDAELAKKDEEKQLPACLAKCRPKKDGTPPRYLWNIGKHHFGPPWLIVVGAVIAMLGLGSIYSWGTLSVFVSAPGFLQYTPSTTSVFIYSMSLAMIPISMFVASFLQEKVGVMGTTMIGSTLAGIGIMVSSVATSFIALFFTWGVVAGFGIGLGYVCCVVLPAKWFPAYKGLVSGISVGAFGAGSFMFSLLVKALSNPDNVPTRSPLASDSSDDGPALWSEMFHSEMARNVPIMFIVIGAVSFILSMLGALTLQPVPILDTSKKDPKAATEKPAAKEEATVAVAAPEKPVEKDVEKGIGSLRKEGTTDEGNGPDEPLSDGHFARATAVDQKWRFRKGLRLKSFSEAAPQTRIGKASIDLKDGYPPLATLRTLQFWLIWVFMGLCQTAGMCVIGSYSAFARTEGTFANPQYDLIGGFGAIGNALGRVIWGRLTDLVDYRRLFLANSLILGILMFVYSLTKGNQGAFGLVTSLIYFCYGGFFGILPNATGDAFGLKHISRNYALMFTSTVVSAFLQSVLLRVLVSSLGYTKLFYLMGGLVFVGSVIMFIYKPPDKGVWCGIWLNYKVKPEKKETAKPEDGKENEKPVQVKVSSS